jgi:hypothetical protein
MATTATSWTTDNTAAPRRSNRRRQQVDLGLDGARPARPSSARHQKAVAQKRNDGRRRDDRRCKGGQRHGAEDRCGPAPRCRRPPGPAVQALPGRSDSAHDDREIEEHEGGEYAAPLPVQPSPPSAAPRRATTGTSRRPTTVGRTKGIATMARSVRGRCGPTDRGRGPPAPRRRPRSRSRPPRWPGEADDPLGPARPRTSAKPPRSSTPPGAKPRASMPATGRAKKARKPRRGSPRPWSRRSSRLGPGHGSDLTH